MKVPRFKLRTLFLLVAVFAVASWAYWIGWPWWQDYLEQSRFEQAVQKIKVGMTVSQIKDLMPQSADEFETTYSWDGKVAGLISVWECEFRSAIYVITVQYPGPETRSIIPPIKHICGVQVFRVFPVPNDYPKLEKEQSEQFFAYRYDLLGIFYRGVKNVHGIKYELIYSDPPQKPDNGSK